MMTMDNSSAITSEQHMIEKSTGINSHFQGTEDVAAVEQPTITEILDRFVSLYYPTSSNKDAKTLSKRFVKEFNKLVPPSPANGDDDNSATYRRAYNSWSSALAQQRNNKEVATQIVDHFGKSLMQKTFESIYNTVLGDTNGKVAKLVLAKMHTELSDFNSIMYRLDYDNLKHHHKTLQSSAKKKRKRSRAIQEDNEDDADDDNNKGHTELAKRIKIEQTVEGGSSSVDICNNIYSMKQEEHFEADNRIVMTTIIWTPHSTEIKNNDAVSALVSDPNKTELDMVLGPETIYASMSRDEIAKKEEEHGNLSFEVVRNDSDIRSLEKLLALKNIFGRQLPKMPKEYITRLVFDRNHRSMVGFKGNRVVGGITFRPFFEQGFGEIAFCAITGNEQVKGYGTRLMNHLKDYCQSVHVYRFLTYADNYAIGYFKKQGFTKEITLDEDRHRGYIKDYDGGTLMECVLRPKIPYLDVPGMLKKQRAAVYEKMREISNSHIVHPGIDIFKKGGKVTSIEQIPGLKEAGFKDEDLGDSGMANEQLKKQRDKLRKVLRQLQDHEDAWPFLLPVDAEAVPDYYDVIKDPIDLSTIEVRLEDNYYRTMDMFVSDLRLMFENCRTYNAKGTPYYECADNLEAYFKKLMRSLLIS